jgi:hypothetical protein
MKTFTIQVNEKDADKVVAAVRALDGVEKVREIHKIAARTKRLRPKGGRSLRRAVAPKTPAQPSEKMKELLAYLESIGITDDMPAHERFRLYMENWRPAGIFDLNVWNDEVLFGRDPELEAYF